LARALSSYGREACEYLISGLAGYPESVVSGMALGADACAHRAAMRAGLHTIAIPGSGLGKEVLYPRSHLQLASDIIEAGGALLSEHPPEYQAHPYDFPSRNRIMVVVAEAVLMIESGERSGTLITARLAGEYNRHLLCFPHRIGDPHSYGSHFFLRMGATLVSKPEHILEALRIPPKETKTEALFEQVSPKEQQLLALLSDPKSRDELLRSSSLPPHETLGLLGTLELQGLIEESFGLWRRK
jgi:DNA processing protein